MRPSTFELLTAELSYAKQALAYLDKNPAEQSFVIVCDDVPLSFTIEGGQVLNPRTVGSALEATRFTKLDAEAIAASVAEHTGEDTVAVRIRDVVLSEINALKKRIRSLH